MRAARGWCAAGGLAAKEGGVTAGPAVGCSGGCILGVCGVALEVQWETASCSTRTGRVGLCVQLGARGVGNRRG